MKTNRKKYNKVHPKQSEIARMREEGLTLSEIGLIVGFTKSQVHYSLRGRKSIRNKNVPVKKENPSASIGLEKIQRINVLTNWGYKPNEISEDVSLPTALVHKVISDLKDSNKIQRRV